MMRKSIIILLVIISFYCKVFCTDLYPLQYEGTYISEIFNTILLNTQSYYEAIKKTDNLHIYDIICLRNNNVYSNVKFHDAYMLDSNEIKFSFFEEESIQYISNNKDQNRYIKISDSIDYYSAFRRYLSNNILTSDKLIDYKKLEVNDYGFHYLNKDWIIDIDKYHYGDEVLLIFMNKNGYGECLGLVKSNNDYLLYSMKDSEEYLEYVVNRKIDSYSSFSSTDYMQYIQNNYEKGDQLYNQKNYSKAVLYYHEAVDYFEFIKYAQSQDMLTDVDELTKIYYFSIYNVACCYSILNEVDLSRTYLIYSIDQGYPFMDYMFKDEDLINVFGVYRNLKNDIMEKYRK